MMVRSIFLLAYAFVGGSAALAQTPAPANTPAIFPLPAAAASSAPTSRVVSSSVNPLTGVPLDFEQKQRLIEDTKLQTSLYKEQLEQGKVKMDLNLLPLKERNERLQLGGANNSRVDAGDTGAKVARSTKERTSKGKKPTSANSELTMMPQAPQMAMGSGFIEFAGEGGSRERVGFGNSRRVASFVLTDIAAASSNTSTNSFSPNNPPLPPAMARSAVPVAPNVSGGGTGFGSFRSSR